MADDLEKPTPSAGVACAAYALRKHYRAPNAAIAFIGREAVALVLRVVEFLLLLRLRSQVRHNLEIEPS